MGAVALLIVSLVVAGAVVGTTSYDGRPHAAVGEIFDHPFQEDPLPDRGEVLLPWARVQVGVASPRDELPDLLGAEANLQAPAGGSFVRVDVVLAEDFMIPLAAVALPYVEETSVVLRADGRDYPMTGDGGIVLDPNGPAGQAGTRWVAVEGEPADLEVRVTVDGQTQVVAGEGSAELGRAAELGDIPSNDELADLKRRPCGEVTTEIPAPLRIAGYSRPTCRVSLVLRTPYVDGLGWAEEGQEFVLVHVVVYRRVAVVTGSGNDLTYWDADELEMSGELGGSPAVAQVPVNDLAQGTFAFQDADDPEQLVFGVDADAPLPDLTLTVSTTATLGEPFPTDEERIEARWTVPGEKLS